MKVKVFDDGFEGHVRRSLARAIARQGADGWSRKQRLLLPTRSTCSNGCRDNALGLSRQSGNRS